MFYDKALILEIILQYLNNSFGSRAAPAMECRPNPAAPSFSKPLKDPAKMCPWPLNPNSKNTCMEE
jgi:hypothetical protein